MFQKFICLLWFFLVLCDECFQGRTWSVPSHIPLPPLYVRPVAPNGAQHQEGREAALNRSWAQGPASASSSDWKILWLLSDWPFAMESGSDFLNSGLGMALRESYFKGAQSDWFKLSEILVSGESSYFCHKIKISILRKNRTRHL